MAATLSSSRSASGQCFSPAASGDKLLLFFTLVGSSSSTVIHIMENFVFNLFREQLSRIIVDFSPSSINANFLSGRGSITNVRLNVDLINGYLSSSSSANNNNNNRGGRGGGGGSSSPGGIFPSLEFVEVYLSELRVEVTSYANLKRSPIVLVIGEIRAVARERLEYGIGGGAGAKEEDDYDYGPSSSTASTTPQPQTQPQQQQYGILHRILDNLSVKIGRAEVSFSSLGKFKTRRRGPWTPPSVRTIFDGVEWASVSESGHAGSPDSVWAHNDARDRDRGGGGGGHHHRSYVIYKRLTAVCRVELMGGGEASSERRPAASSSSTTTNTKTTTATLLSDARIEAHIAYTRRLRDAGVSGADVDVRIRDVDVDLDATSAPSLSSSSSSSGRCELSSFAHALVGLVHCYYRDRPFVDPLLPDGILSSSVGPTGGGFLESGGTRGIDRAACGDGEGAVAGPDGFLPEVALLDDELHSSDESDLDDEQDAEHDEVCLAWKEREEPEETPTTGSASERGDSVFLASDVGRDDDPRVSSSTKRGEGGIEAGSRGDNKNEKRSAGPYERKRKAVIVIASGAQKFEKLSFSLSIPRINMKLHLPSSKTASNNELSSPGKDGVEPEANYYCLELLLEGLVAECIWPKNSLGEMGGHVQGSIKYCHVLETAYRGTKEGACGPKPRNVVKMSPLLRLGTRIFQGHDVFSLSPRVLGNHHVVNNASKCDEFPLMEDRQTTWSWNRQVSGRRAFAFKSTISFIDETLSRWSKTNVQHEASLGELEVVLDSAPLERLSKIFSYPRYQENIWFDERWLSGEWHAEISSEMVAFEKGGFWLQNHVQPLPSLFPSRRKRSAPSSELRSVTAHLDTITFRLPNPMQDLASFRMADVIFSISEATILVSSDLPPSFLSGDITPENSEHDFPHDPADISSIAAGQATDMRAHTDHETKFRMQVSLFDCQVTILPVHAYSLGKTELALCNLIAPTNVTVLMSLEHKEAQQTSKDTNQSNALTSKSLVLSVLVQKLEFNVVLRNIYYALETVHYHAESVINAFSSSGNVDRCVPAVAESATDIAEEIAATSIICIHVPGVEILAWDDQTHAPDQRKHNLLCRVKAGQFEFGMECKNTQSHVKEATVYKCFFESLLVEICSRLDEHTFKMVEILSFGRTTSSSNIVEKACFYFLNDVTGTLKRGFILRAEYESAESISSALALEIACPLFVDLNINAIECFLNLMPQCLLSSVFVGSSSHIGKTLLGSALMLIGLKVSEILKSNQSDPRESEISDGMDNSFFRLSIHQLIVLVPSNNESSFVLSLSDVEVAAGKAKDIASHPCVPNKNCGSGNRTWLGEFYLLGEEKTRSHAGTFYLLRSSYRVLRVASNEIIVPASSINWSSPVGLGGYSNAPPFDIFAMKDLILSFMHLGMPFSSLYFKLYKLSPNSAESAQDFSLASSQLHDSIGSYHCKIHDVIGQLTAEIDRLRCKVFSKENERVGALAMASSDASGWVRVGEEMNFSHRLFSSATFWRYWCVLDNNLIILYETPGAVPSFVIPLRASSQLRSLAMSSSSSKIGSSIVGEHVRLKGFALFDSEVGSGLFFVATDISGYHMWVRAISAALKKVKLNVSENIGGVNQDNGELPTESDQYVDSFQTYDGTAFVSPQGEDIPMKELSEPTNDGALERLTLLDSDSENLEMEEISLGCDETGPNDFPAFNENASSAEMPFNRPPSSAPNLPIKEPLPIRERLALAKGKSKTTFGSALKTAKGGIIAVSEVGRHGVKQTVLKQASREDEPTKRSLAVGQTMSRLKINANTKMTAALSSMQDQKSATTGSLPEEKSVLGPKISLLKTLVASTPPSTRVQVPKDSNDDDDPEPSGQSSKAYDEISGNLSQDIRKKLFNLDQSMSNTMRRLKIDEKVNQLSAAVKSGVMNDPVMRQIGNVNRSQSRNSEHSRQRLGIGDERKSMKPIKFDARETFSASSDLPLKIKSPITYGETLLVDDSLSEKVQSLRKIEGSWVVTVDSINLVEDKPMILDPTNHVEYGERVPCSVNPEKQPSFYSQDPCRWKYRIVATEISGGSSVGVQASVERTISEVLTFHTRISETIANHLPTTAEFNSQRVLMPDSVDSSILQKLSPMDGLRISGQLLETFLDVNSPPSDGVFVRDKYCKLVKLFFSTLLGCHIPVEAVSATKVFLGIGDLLSESDSYASTIETHSLSEAYNRVSIAEAQPMSRTNQVEFDTESDQAYSSLINVLMEGYTAAVRERDKALANLATTSIINDNSIMNEYLNSSHSMPRMINKKDLNRNSTDEEMLNLCRQLGNEIESRTLAEIEINRLNDRLEFEQKIAHAKERELRAELAKYKNATQHQSTEERC